LWNWTVAAFAAAWSDVLLHSQQDLRQIRKDGLLSAARGRGRNTVSNRGIANQQPVSVNGFGIATPADLELVAVDPSFLNSQGVQANMFEIVRLRYRTGRFGHEIIERLVFGRRWFASEKGLF
jgi:hypothetical protein